MTMHWRARLGLGVVAATLGLGGLAGPAAAQWAQVHEQFYLPADHNWVFRRTYPVADRFFNAFDYGHAILYESLYTKPTAPASELEEKHFDFVTRRLLVSPPRLPLEEGAIEIQYVKIAPEAKAMFEWAHILHRQIYDVLADERLTPAQKDQEVARVLQYYKSRRDLAFSSRPKSMELMEGQYYSTAFREKYPKFNGLIWGYHWLQVGLYEPLVTGRTTEERQTGVAAAVTRFRQMLENAPHNMPRLMPMTAAIAPVFSARYPEVAIIFDNLHSMHDVISDILASPEVPRDRKRAEILVAAQRYRDDTSFVMTEAEWLDMTRMMGIENMGGPATGFVAGFPEPTVARGAVMAHGGMGGMQHGQAAGAHDHAAMTSAAGGGHAGMHGTAPGAGAATDSGSSVRRMRELHQRLMADPVIRQRIEADPELRGMMEEMHGDGVGHDAHHAPAAAAPIRPEVMDFVERLLSDPSVEARVHTDPRLHALWNDPDVQRRLAEIRRSRSTAPAAPPAAGQPHQHR